uniref:Hypothetical conserved protein n=1 Tax=uncultured prokaryote TaxID=198431 RepID=H5S979_9ZZZZ|nr:hypothetical conserved protein [uncultured prokaryote]
MYTLCVAIVLDTSFLIALAKVGGLDLLKHLEPERLVPTGVIEELKVGRRKGAPEAQPILETLKQLRVQERKVQASSVDEAVISLAKAERAEMFTNDIPLRSRAQAQGVIAFGVEDFLFLLLCRGVLIQKEYQRLIGELWRRGQIGKDQMARYLDLQGA